MSYRSTEIWPPAECTTDRAPGRLTLGCVRRSPQTEGVRLWTTLQTRGAAVNAEVFTCPHCGGPAPNPNDIRERYCGACHWWTGVPELYEPWRQERELSTQRDSHDRR